MYGGGSKLGGRGEGGAGGTKRLSSFPPPLPHLSSSTAPNSRLSRGGGSNPRNRSGPSTSTPASIPSVEETCSLIPGNNPPAFGMAMRLTPDLVEEIRRVEAQGGTARMKFDSMGSNTTGNVIDVGGKEFRFTWSRELGDLCDIYEEHQSGEEGNGSLVESGSVQWKVNVQPVLDESTKNRVKMRSEEAERKHKARRAINLDHGDPSMKSQIKQLALAESNPRRFNKKKEQPFKKLKVDPPIVPKSTFKPVVPSTAIAKGRRSSSSLPSTSEKSPAVGFEEHAQSNAKVEEELSALDNAGISKHTESSVHGHKFSEKSSNMHENFPIQREKRPRENQNEDNFVQEKKRPRNSKEIGPGGRHSSSFDTHHRKQGETFGKFNDAAQITNSQMGPIKNYYQYKEYVQEYRDKYDSYCSLNKILENYRNDFSEMGKDLDITKGRDMDRYNKILGLLKESYRECGVRCKRLEKIFIILHEELKNLKQRLKEYALSYELRVARFRHEEADLL
ncbi:uncharacterized protein [Euphorbia lathyris]|uniref:uncharacterized protein n=1 Tax=Euphorbia lathyris TaxID=212925 RepID=UPI0033136178